MKEKRIAKNLVISGVLCATAIVGCSFLFNGATNVVKDKAISKDPVVVNYPNVVDEDDTNGVVLLSTDSKVPEGYVKADYTVKDFVMPDIPEPAPLPPNTDDTSFCIMEEVIYETENKPSEYDITRDEAAELGVQMLWELFDVDATDMVVTMNYRISRDGTTPSQWQGSVSNKDKSGKFYTFDIHSITGERLGASLWGYNPYNENAVIPTKPPITPMVESEYFEIAKDYVKKHNLMSGEIVKCENLTPNDEGIPREEMEAVGGSNSAMFSDQVHVRVTDSNGAETDVDITRPGKEVFRVSYDKDIKCWEIPNKVYGEMRKNYPLYNYELTDAEQSEIDAAIKVAMDEYFN